MTPRHVRRLTRWGAVVGLVAALSAPAGSAAGRVSEEGPDDPAVATPAPETPAVATPAPENPAPETPAPGSPAPDTGTEPVATPLPEAVGTDPAVREPPLAAAVDPAFTAAPRVSWPGTTVTLSGDACPGGTVLLTITGRSTGWYDLPTTYPSVTLTGHADGTWAAAIPMPPEVVRVDLMCTLVGELRWGSLILGALGGPGQTATITQEDGAVVVRVPITPYGPPGDVEAFLPDGTPVGLTPLEEYGAYLVDGAPTTLVLLGTVLFGENASADVNESPEQFLVGTLPASPDPGMAGPRLADSGADPLRPVGLALLLVAVGAALAGGSLAMRRGPAPTGDRAS